MIETPPECLKSETRFSAAEIRISVAQYKEFAREWIMDGELRKLSPRTIAERLEILGKLFWFLDREGFQTFGVTELKLFFHHLNTDHAEAADRFGNPRSTKPLRPVNLRGWHIVLAAWYWSSPDNADS